MLRTQGSETKSIQFLNLRASYGELKDELDEAYRSVMEAGWYILGSEVEAFEREWEYCNVEYASGSEMAWTLSISF